MTTNNVVKEKPKLQSVQDLAHSWKSHMNVIYEIEKPLTPKEFGQLKNLRDKLGDLTGEVLDHTLKSWPTFCDRIKLDKALSFAPSVPNIGFLLVHAGTAINLMHSLTNITKEKSVADIDFTTKIDQLIDQQETEVQEHSSEITSEGDLIASTSVQNPQISNMLDQQFHARIIADCERVCAVAGIQKRYLLESMQGYCGPAEVDWVRNFKRYEAAAIPGLLITDATRPHIICQAIAGALVRNYIDARVMSVNSVLDAYKDGENMVAPHVLLIPNMYIQATGRAMPSWRVQVLYDLLLERTVHGKPNVLCAETSQGLITAYGQPFADYLSSYKTLLGQG